MNFNKTVNTYWSEKNQEIISCWCCVLMVVGLFFARAVLSISMIVFFINALHPQKIQANWRQFRHSWFAILSIVFFAVYLLSGLWSDDKESWLSTVMIKLPFVFLPFAMADLPFKKMAFIKTVIAAVLACIFVGMVYSFSFLAFARYRTGEHLPSPMEGDYIRFTIAIVLSLLCAIYLYNKRKQYNLSKTHIRLMMVWALLAILYIHVQAAKSGLVSFYLLAGVLTLHSFVRGKHALLMICGIVAAIVLGAVVLSKLPSVQKQIEAIEYEKKVWQTNDTVAFNSSYSFVPRIISYEVAMGITLDHPIAGVGAGDVMPEIEKVYAARYSTIRKEGRILPHNQFLCTALATGIPAGVLLLVLVIIPFTIRKYRNIYMTTTTLIMIFGMLIEPMLEVQFGVFVYLFFTLLWTKIPVHLSSNSSTLSESE